MASEEEDEDSEEGNRLEELRPGHNRFTWDLAHEDAEDFEGMILWGGGTDGPRAAPGTYGVRLTVDGDLVGERRVEVLPDPRSSASVDDLVEQERFLLEVRDKLSEVHRAIRRIREVRAQVEALSERLGDGEETADARAAAEALSERDRGDREGALPDEEPQPAGPAELPHSDSTTSWRHWRTASRWGTLGRRTRRTRSRNG